MQTLPHDSPCFAVSGAEVADSLVDLQGGRLWDPGRTILEQRVSCDDTERAKKHR